MKVKNAMQVIALIFALGGASGTYAQIPVTVTSDIPAIINQIQTMMQWANQLQEMANQLEAMDKQFDSMNGVRGMTALLDDPSLRSYLPADMAAVLESTSAASDKYARAGRLLKSGAWQNAAAEAAKQLDKRERSNASDLAVSEQTYEKAEERIGEFQQFVDKIDSSTDPKAIADLQARIASESVFLQNEQIRVQSLQMAQAAKRDMLLVREREMMVNMSGPSTVDYSAAFE